MCISQISFLSLFVVILTSQWIDTSSAKSIEFEGYGELRPVNYYLSAKDEKIILYKLICRGWPCPEFKVEKDVTPFMQERNYEPFSTASIKLAGCGNFSDYLLDGYRSLFRYRRGSNDENQRMTMSVPVLIEVKPPADDADCYTEYTVHYYLNTINTLEGVPKPTESNVTLGILSSDLRVYVETYIGYVYDYVPKWKSMKEDMDKLGLSYRSDKYYIAFYDPPWKKHGRRNELWAITNQIDKRSKSQQTGLNFLNEK